MTGRPGAETPAVVRAFHAGLLQRRAAEAIARLGECDLCPHAMAQPSHPHVRDVLHPRDVIQSVHDLIHHLGIDAVGHTCEYRLS